jgi:hypothetical protein
VEIGDDAHDVEGVAIFKRLLTAAAAFLKPRRWRLSG